MNDIDFIKWKVNYAEGFEWLEGNIGFQPCIQYKEQICIANLVTEWDLYPLLLQKVIEGISIGMKKDGFNWTCRMYDTGKWLSGHNNPDRAKEQALKYIYEQEKK